MKKTLVSLLLAGLLLLSGCGRTPTTESALRLACTTYPVYLLTQAVTESVEDVSVELVIDEEVSCLHDYTLTMQDMEAVERADVVICNGAGLEEFLEDVLVGRESIDCSQGIDLIHADEAETHDHHDDHGDHIHDVDPHIWMAPENAAVMARNIADGLSELDPDNAARYQENAEQAAAYLVQLKEDLAAQLEGRDYGIITFHDGFGYFADSFGIELLASVEEEEGSEASAKTITEIVGLVEEYQLPAIFTETNGSDATARTVCRECGIETYPLSMCMSGDGHGLEGYASVLRSNIETILEAYQ